MSWSLTFIGTPEKISEKLNSYSDTLKDQSKIEFDDAKPHLQALINQNVNINGLVKLSGNGHATFDNGVKTYGTLNATIESFYGEVLL